MIYAEGTSVAQLLESQPSFSGFCPVENAVDTLALSGGIEERGAVFTRREVVDFILDLVGYTVDQPLTNYKLLEPSFGDGDFLLPAIERLLESARRNNLDSSLSLMKGAIRAVELHIATYENTWQKVVDLLVKHEFRVEWAIQLADSWLTQCDYLLEPFHQSFTHVIGNPPYVRQENIPDVLMSEYRRRFSTIYDRADLYVPFIEKSLRLLKPDGKLGFICSDRWMKNKYGKKLRELVSKDYSLTSYIDMVGTDAFHSEVTAYPAITVIEFAKNPKMRVFAKPKIEANFLSALAVEMAAPALPVNSDVRELERVTADTNSWVMDSFDELTLARRLEAEFPLIEDAGCKIGIGVATGADKIFIGNFDEMDVEESRKLPLAVTKDIVDGHIHWKGKGIINPFGDDGKLVDLDEFPKLRAYLDIWKSELLARHIAKKNPRNWYKTIDRIYPNLAWQPKLLIPDIKGDATIAYEKGALYPHHNLYYITSSEWDVHALQAVMRSGIARLFVALYCTRMRGGYLRFQAQYLRKIRLPKWSEVCDETRQKLMYAAASDDTHMRNEVVADLYNLSADELKLIERSILDES